MPGRLLSDYPFAVEHAPMKIDASRFTAFWSNPDKFRLREYWRLSPVEPSAGSFASLLSFGRRRGTVFHEFMDGNYRQVTAEQTVQEVKDGGFSDKEISVAKGMAEVALARYGAQEYLAHEALFEVAIPDSSHSLVGRIDSVVRVDDEVFVRDYKTSKYRTKKELTYKGAEYCRGVQVPFYLLGARSLGFEPTRFVYSLVSPSKRDNSGFQITEFSTERTAAELRQLMRSVHITCELILWLKGTFGVEQAWPVLPETFSSGYESLLGRRMYPEFIPEGYQPKIEHLPIAEIFPKEAA